MACRRETKGKSQTKVADVVSSDEEFLSAQKAPEEKEAIREKAESPVDDFDPPRRAGKFR